MKQRFLKWVFAMITCIIPGTAQAYDFSWDGLYYNKLSNTEVEVTEEGNGAHYSGEIVVPASVMYKGVTYTVTKVGNWAFANCYYITQVTLPETLTSIGKYAFYSCSRLPELTIPAKVTNIGEEAFSDTMSLYNLTILNPIPPFCITDRFENSGLHYVYVPDGSVNYYKSSSPWNSYYILNWFSKESLSYGIINNSEVHVKSCDKSATGKIEIPKTVSYKGKDYNVTSISNMAFYGCSHLTEITIPNSVTAIAREAFSGCSDLTEITIPNSVTSIDDLTFYGCSSLTEITIPTSVTSIRYGAFASCSKLGKIICLNAEAPSILESSFEGLYDTATVEIPDGSENSYLCSAVWPKFKNLNTVSNTLAYYDDNVFSYYINKVDKNAYLMKYTSENTSSAVSIPDRVVYESAESERFFCEVTGIAFRAFYGNTNISSVKFPKNLKAIGDEAFYNCTGLTSLEFPAALESIGEKSFRECTGFQTLTFPAALTTIGDYAFYDCTGLKSIDFNDALTEIGSDTFRGCTSLQTLTLPANLTTIGDDAFYDCSSLKSINFNDALTEIRAWAFRGCTSLQTLTFPAALTTIGEYAFYYCSSLKSIDFNDALTEIGEWTFRDCTSLQTLTLPANLTTIGESAFYSCTGLESINFNDALTEIGDNAFEKCTELQTLTFPAALTTLGDFAFNGCTGLESINFNDALTVIGDNAFEKCTELQTLTFPAALTTLGNNAFKNCSQLETISFNNSLSFIGDHAFENIAATSITIPGSVEAIDSEAFLNCKNLAEFNLLESTSAINIGQDILKNAPISSLYIGRDYEGTLNFSKDKLTKLELGNNISSIPNEVLYCKYLKTLKLGSMLTSIPDNAFKGCSSLKEVIIPKNVTSIGANAFDGCTSIKTLAIGAGVTEIGEYAFNNVNDIPSVNITAVTPPSANNNTFSNYDVPLYVPEASVDAYYNNLDGCWYRFTAFAAIDPTDVQIVNESQISQVKPGDTIQLTATVLPANVTMPYITWHSSNPDFATVDNNGLVTVNMPKEAALADAAQECEIIAETLYADAPVGKVTIIGGSLSIVNGITDNDGAIERNNDIYTLQGVCVKRNASQADIDALTPGLYIIGGKKVLKR